MAIIAADGKAACPELVDLKPVAAEHSQLVQRGNKDDKEQGDSHGPKELLWWGPTRVGPFVLALHGPLQLFFIIASVFAFILVIYQVVLIAQSDEGLTAVDILSTAGFFAVAVCLVWFAKGMYILKWLRMEISKFRQLNAELKNSVGELNCQVRDLHHENRKYAAENAQYQSLNEDLAVQVGTLKKVEQQLSVLATECGGNVAQAKSLVERLDRNLKLDTVNTVFQFFHSVGRNENKITPEQVGLFVDNLSMLWKHLPTFHKDDMKASLIEQGGITLEQVHSLVEALMAEDDERRIAEASMNVRRSFQSNSLQGTASIKEPPNCEAPEGCSAKTGESRASKAARQHHKGGHQVVPKVPSFLTE